MLYLWLCNPTALLLTFNCFFFMLHLRIILWTFYFLVIYHIFLFVIIILIFFVITSIILFKILVLSTRIVVNLSRSVVTFILIMLCTWFLLKFPLFLTSLIILLALFIVLLTVSSMWIILVIFILIYRILPRWIIGPTKGILFYNSSLLYITTVTSALSMLLLRNRMFILISVNLPF